MAKFDKDSVGGTIGIVFALSLICSVIVAGSAVLLKPTQEEQKALDKQKNILKVANLYDANSKINVQEVYSKHIDPRCVQLDTGDYVQCPANYDSKAAAKDPKQSTVLSHDEDTAGIRNRENLAEVYLVKDDEGKVQQVVLPIYGRGLWSTMYGFVSVKSDANTINDITYYEHGETPGLGGEIENRPFQTRFKDKKLFDEQGKPALHVGKGASSDKEHGIDAISGSTLTSKGVNNTFKFWLGPKGFGPYLAKLQKEGIN
ncbi:MAG: Na(+)-translocating NADH-quinone reductase subunit C [Pasteurellaceae bacterium]|nr:Na(+)-translocating NADH-quinone reductase subunit C [Pasteurellaceae bacterium]